MEWTPEEKKDIPPLYGCEILLENTTMDLVKDPSFPNDAYIVVYRVNNKKYIDLCRGNRRCSFLIFLRITFSQFITSPPLQT